MLIIRRSINECKSVTTIALVGICLLIAGATVVYAGSPGSLAAEPRLEETEQETGARPDIRDNAWSEYAVGVFLMESGNVLKASNHLENAWRLSGRNTKVGLHLAETYFVLKNFSRCEVVVDDVLQRNSVEYDAMVLKAKIRYIKRDPYGAMEMLENVRTAHGSRFETERLLGNIAYEAGDIDTALEAYEKCMQLDPSYPYIQYRYGILLTQVLRYGEAEAAFSRAIQLDPGFTEPAMELAKIYADSDRTGEAAAVLEEALEVDRSNVTVLIALSEVYLEIGRLDDGILLLEERRGVAALPRDAEILRGRLYYEAGDYKEATGVFSALLDKEKDNAELARILGEISLRAGDPERSRDYFDKAIEMDRSDYRSYLGKFFAATPSFNENNNVIELTLDERAELLDSASQLVEGSDFDGNYLLGVCYLSIDSFERAKTHLLQANTLDADDRGTLLNLANVHEKLKELGEAEKYLSRLYKLTPDDPMICNFYGYLLAEMRKDLDFAENLIKTALLDDPENGYYLDSLGWVYYQMGEYSKSVIELEKASLRVTDDPVILEHLGDAYRALRRMPEARTAYQKSSRLQDGNQEILEKIQSTKPESP
jgi:tetratricopeptide (TPR) repeat protein